MSQKHKDKNRMRINISVDISTYGQLDKLARRKFIPVGTYVRQLVQEHVTKNNFA